MDSMEEQYGFDANFIGDIPDYFKCVVCHLVLRQPVQIMSCGHRFCKPCFDRIQGYSKYLNSTLCCPVDREVVDMNKVFEDTAVARDIGNLQVTCSSSSQGCSWQGDLRLLQISDQPKPVCTEDVLMKELLQRVQSCEESLLGKEKDITHLKFNLNEMKDLSEKKEKELDSIKMLNTELKNELQVVKRLNKESKVEFDKEVLFLKDEIKILETKVNTLEEHNNAIEVGLKGRKDSDILEKQIKDIHSELTNKFSSHKEYVEMEFKKSLIPVKNEISQVQKDVQKTFNEIKAIRSHTDKSFNTTSNKITNITTRLEATEKLMENDKVNELTRHVDNIENVLFSYMPYVNNAMKFKWVLTDCKYHLEKNRFVFSPMFYPPVNGYCFKLMVRWIGANKERFGLGIQLCRGRNAFKDLEPFKLEYQLAIRHKNGTDLSRKLSIANFDDVVKNDCFTILPNQQKAKPSGSGEMLSKPEVQDYVINDTMYITCTFKLD